MLRFLAIGTVTVLHSLLAISLAVAQTATLEGQWPQFRGPLRNGVSPDTGLLTQWPAEGPPLVWETAGAGRGYASLSIAQERIFTLGDAPSTAADADEYVSCFDQATGKQLWLTKLGPAWTSGQPDWQSSRSTPTVDGELLYVITAHGKLACLKSQTGEAVWEKSLPDDFGGKKGDGWGYSESVLIDGDKLVCTPGGPTATMVALDKKTGEVIWKAVRPDDRGAGHASIIISEVGGVRVYVQTTAGGALGVRASDGQLQWSYPIDSTIAVIPNTIVRDDLVFFTAGYRRGGALLKQVPTGDGSVKMEEVYPLKTDLSNKHGGVVLVGDYLYGDTDSSGVPYCAELMTGELKWKERLRQRFGRGHGRRRPPLLPLHQRRAGVGQGYPRGIQGNQLVQDPRQRRSPQLVPPGHHRRQALPPRTRPSPLLRRQGQGLTVPAERQASLEALIGAWCMRRIVRWSLLAGLCGWVTLCSPVSGPEAAGGEGGVPLARDAPQPLTPAESQRRFRVPEGFSRRAGGGRTPPGRPGRHGVRCPGTDLRLRDPRLQPGRVLGCRSN